MKCRLFVRSCEWLHGVHRYEDDWQETYNTVTCPGEIEHIVHTLAMLIGGH